MCIVCVVENIDGLRGKRLKLEDTILSCSSYLLLQKGLVQRLAGSLVFATKLAPPFTRALKVLLPSEHDVI